MKQNIKKQTLQESALLLMLSTLLVKIISAFFKIPLASNYILGDLGFGYFSVAHDIFMPFYVLAISGLPVAVSHITAEYIAQNRFADIKKIFYLTRKIFVFAGIGLAALMSAIVLPIAFASSTNFDALYSIFAVIPSIFLMFLISAYRGYYEGFCNMYPTSISKLIEAFGKLILGLGLAYLTIKITKNPALAAGAAMLGITLGALIATIYLHISFKKNGEKLILNDFGLSNEPINIKKTVKLILLLAVPMAVSSLASSAVALIDVVTLKSIISANATGYWKEISGNYPDLLNSFIGEEGIAIGEFTTFLYGVRSKAFTIYNLVPTITMAFGVGALPILTECCVKKDKDGVKENLNGILKLISIIALPAGIGLVALSKPIMKLLYFDVTNFGGNLLLVYGIAAIFAGFAIPLTSILQSFNRQFSALRNIIIGIILKLITNIFLISSLEINLFGAAIGTIVCYLYITISHLVSIYTTVGNVICLKNTLLKPFISAFCCGISAYLISMISESKFVTCVGIFVAVLVYVILIILLKTFSKQEIFNLPKGEKLYNFGKKLKITK